MLMVSSKHWSVLGRPFHMLIVGGQIVDLKIKKVISTSQADQTCSLSDWLWFV